MEIFVNLLFIPFILLLNNLLKKNNYLTNYTGEKHQLYTNQKSIPISGGIVILIFFIINSNNYDNLFLLSIIIFFLIGILGDINILKFTFLRFLIQTIFIILFIFIFNLSISDIRIEFLNSLLLNPLFNYFFTCFCLLVFVNGSNFIDGNNTLSIGYFTIITVTIISLENLNIDIIYEYNFLISLFTLLIILFLFNCFNKIFLGDNGIYLLSLFFGYLILNIYSKNYDISPYFIAVLLWYPSFEILFSFIRKLMSKKSPMKPDNNHFHQNLYFYFNKKFKNKIFNNTLTGLSINLINMLMIFLSLQDIFNTKYQVLLLCLYATIYLFAYLALNNFKKSNI